MHKPTWTDLTEIRTRIGFLYRWTPIEDLSRSELDTLVRSLRRYFKSETELLSKALRMRDNAEKP